MEVESEDAKETVENVSVAAADAPQSDIMEYQNLQSEVETDRAALTSSSRRNKEHHSELRRKKIQQREHSTPDPKKRDASFKARAVESVSERAAVAAPSFAHLRCAASTVVVVFIITPAVENGNSDRPLSSPAPRSWYLPARCILRRRC